VISRTVVRALADAVRWRDLPAVVARHPGLRGSLHRGHFWNREHLTFAIAVAGLPIARRSPALAAAAAIPYLGSRVNWRQPHPRRIARALASVPMFAALDAVEIAARLPSAVRHRAAVLECGSRSSIRPTGPRSVAAPSGLPTTLRPRSPGPDTRSPC
jgi:hypothetical protein